MLALQGSLDPGSSGGTLPDLGGLDADGTVGLAMSMRSHREKVHDISFPSQAFS